VFRYHLFDPAGFIVFSSDYIEEGRSWRELAGHGDQVKQLDDALHRGEVVVELKDGRNRDDRPPDYSEAYVPLMDGKKLKGAIEVYVDLTDKVHRYWRSFGLAILGLAFLLALAAALPGAFIWRQLQSLRMAQAHIKELAFLDTLTGLPNRRMFQDRLRQAVSHAKRHGERGALILMDLDHFKGVNDSLGHGAGDHLLNEVSHRLSSLLRDEDTVARLGGDEFALILSDIPAAEQVAHLAQRIQESLAEPTFFDGHEIHTGASIGITLFPDDGEAPDQLLTNADIALYRAKETGRRTFNFFEAALKKQIDRRREQERDLRVALAADEFVLLYQPQIDLGNDAMVGVEALLRWRRPNGELVQAGEFIQVADEAGILGGLSHTALRRACAQLRNWQDAGIDDLWVAVNVAPAQLRLNTFVNTVAETLNDFGILPSRLVLEVTENVLLGRGAELIAEHLAQLHAIGVRIALDDFGTGYASLTHLRRLPIDQVKIDKSFIQGVESNTGDAEIVRSMIALGHNLRLEIIAEGIETEGQRDFLTEHNCTLAQGFLFGYPQSSIDIAKAASRSTAKQSALLVN
jgi:diguanylate cyclase (GGDEF)-like protein